MARNLSRRRLLRVLVPLLPGIAVLARPAAYAQAPAPPAPAAAAATDKATTVTLESYQSLLKSLEVAAREHASKSGTPLTQEDVRRAHDVVLKIVNDKGYAVPMPPTNLTVH